MTPPTAEHVQGMLNGEAENPEPFTTPIARVIARMWADVYERVEGKAMDGSGEGFNEGENVTITPEQIKEAFDEKLGRNFVAHVSAESMRQILTRILCPEPEQPSPVQPVAAPAKDRAEELAESIVFQHGVASGADMIIGEWGRGSVWLKGYSSSVESVRRVFAMALRAHADEMLENAAQKIMRNGYQDGAETIRWVRSLKSSAPKP